MVWWLVASLVLSLWIGGLIGYMVGVSRGEGPWVDVFREYLDRMPDGTQMQRLIALMARLDAATAPAPAGTGRFPADVIEVMDRDELRERTPKRLREPDNRTFWS